MKFYICLLLTLLCAVSVSAYDYEICDGETDTLAISSLALSPEKPVGGKDLHVSLKGVTQKTITGGKARLQVTSHGATIAHKMFYLCDIVSCPVQPGAFDALVTYKIPLSPGGVRATANIHVVDESENPLSCVSFKFVTGWYKDSEMEGKDPTMMELFDAWRSEYAVQFNSKMEYFQRFMVFVKNHKKILEHNTRYEQGLETSTRAHNAFSHLTAEEFKARFE